MPAISDLDELLLSLAPVMGQEDVVFCAVAAEQEAQLRASLYGNADGASKSVLRPIATLREAEGLTLVLPRAMAAAAGLEYETCFRQITLSVHSSLEAVGLTAAVAGSLAAAGISANVIAGYYHDHIFVPTAQAQAALAALQALSDSRGPDPGSARSSAPE